MAAPAPKIDRQTTTPFLLRLFYSKGSFHPLNDFSPETRLPKDQLQIYTWHSATLGELAHLLLAALPPSLNIFPVPAIGTRVSFRLVIADQNASNQRGPARFQHRELGSVVVGGARAGLDEEDVNGEETAVGKKLEGDKDMSLAQGRFVIGDYVSCAILPPLPDGSVAAPPPPVSMGGMRGGPGNGFGGRGGPPRENGYGGRGDFGGRGDYGGFGRGRGRGGRFGDRDGGVPIGEWRRGEAPPGGPGGGGHWGRGRGRGGGGRGGW